MSFVIRTDALADVAAEQGMGCILALALVEGATVFYGEVRYAGACVDLSVFVYGPGGAGIDALSTGCAAVGKWQDFGLCNHRVAFCQQQARDKESGAESGMNQHAAATDESQSCQHGQGAFGDRQGIDEWSGKDFFGLRS